MRLIVRIVLIVAALLASLFLTAAVLIYFNQHRIVVAVLSSVKQQTGIDIVPAGPISISPIICSWSWTSRG